MTAPVSASVPASGPLDGVFAPAVTTGLSARDLGLGFGDTLTSCLTAACDQAAAPSPSTLVAVAGQHERAAMVASPGALLAAVAAVAAASAPDDDAALPRSAMADDVVAGGRSTEFDEASDATEVTAAVSTAQPAVSAVEGAPPASSPMSPVRDEVDAIAGEPAGADDPSAADAKPAATVTTPNERRAAAAPSGEPRHVRGAGNVTEPPGSVSATPTAMTDPDVSGPVGQETPPVPLDPSGSVAGSAPSDRSGAVVPPVPPDSSHRGRPVAGASAVGGATQPTVAGPDGTASADGATTAAPTTAEHGSDVEPPTGSETTTTPPARPTVGSARPADTAAAAESTARHPHAATASQDATSADATSAAATGADATSADAASGDAASGVTPAPTTRSASSPGSVSAAPEATGSGGDGAEAVAQPLASASSAATPEPASGERPAPSPAAASRILELVERLRHEPPPRQMVVDLASFGVGRLVVSLRGDTVVVAPAQADAALDPQWLRDLGQALDARGWSLNERHGQPSHGRSRRPMPRWDLPHRIDRAGVDDALRL